MNKKTLIAGLLVSVILLVPINSAYSINSLSVKNNADNIICEPGLVKTWVKIIEDGWVDFGNSVIQVSDGGYVVVVTAPKVGHDHEDAFIHKFDSNGNSVWKRVFGDDEFEYQEGFSVIETSNSNFVITGNHDLRVGLTKLSENGKTIWDKTFDILYFSSGNEVIQTSDGGFAIVGYANYENQKNNHSIILLKTDNDGNEIWVKTFDKDLYDYGYSLKQTSDGGYILVGYSQPSADSTFKMWLIKTDENGTLLWDKIFSGKGYSKGFSLQITNDGGYIIIGYTKLANTKPDIWLLKTDAKGEKLWEKTYGGKYEDIGYSVQTTDDGGYILAGSSYKNKFNCDAFLIKTDDIGNVEWSRTYGSFLEDGAKSVQQTTDGGYILTGTLSLPIPRAFLIKTNCMGTIHKSIKTLYAKEICQQNKVTFNSLFIDLNLEKSSMLKLLLKSCVK